MQITSLPLCISYCVSAGMLRCGSNPDAQYHQLQTPQGCLSNHCCWRHSLILHCCTLHSYRSNRYKHRYTTLTTLKSAKPGQRTPQWILFVKYELQFRFCVQTPSEIQDNIIRLCLSYNITKEFVSKGIPGYSAMPHHPWSSAICRKWYVILLLIYCYNLEVSTQM